MGASASQIQSTQSITEIRNQSWTQDKAKGLYSQFLPHPSLPKPSLYQTLRQQSVTTEPHKDSTKQPESFWTE